VNICKLFILFSLIFAIPNQQATAQLPTDRRDGPIFLWPHKEFNPKIYNQYLTSIAQLGAKRIVIPYWGCQKSKTASDAAGCQIASPTMIRQQAEIAMAKGFTVSFLPIVATQTRDWRGDFEPENIELWFSTYTTWIQGVAEVAEELHMPEFVVATEFKKLYKYESHWRQLLKDVRSVFKGPLIITANWDDLNLPFWDAVDAIGFSYYFPLAKSKNPTDLELDQSHLAHKKMLLALSQKYRKPLHMTEIGYPSLDSAAMEPWFFPSPLKKSTPPNLELQKLCFESFVRIWGNEPRVIHTGFWQINHPEGAYAPYNFEILGKPIAEAIANYLKLRAR